MEPSPLAETTFGPWQVLFFAVLFFGVFVTFGLFPADISPFYLAFVFGVAIVQMARRPAFLLKRDSVWIVMIAAAISFIDILAAGNLEVAKLMASFALIFAFMNLRIPRMTYRVALIVAVLWLSASVISLLIPKVFGWLFYRVGVSSSRGATGLGPEPAYWGFASGLMVLFFDRYRFVGSNERSPVLIQLLFGLSALLSLSFLAYVYFFFVLWHIFGARKTALVVLLAIGAVAFVLPSGLRIVELVQKALSSGLVEVLLKDPSSAQRLLGFRMIPDLFTGEFPPWGTLGLQLTDANLDYGVDFNVIAGFQLVFRYGFVGLALCLGILAIFLRPFFSLGRHRSALPIAFLATFLVFIGPIAFPFFLLTHNKLSEKEKT